MHGFRYRISRFVCLGVILLWSSISAQEDSALFNCLAPDSIQPSLPAGERALSPVAIYACHVNAGTTRLPDWFGSIWDTTVGLSVPGFYRDNSLGKYRMKSAAFGRNDTLCFTFTGAGADGGLDFATVVAWFQEVMPLADTLRGINFADFDNDGPNGVPASRDTFHIITDSGDTVIGDVNGDNKADFIIGAPQFDIALSLSGAAYVYSGATGTLIYQYHGAAFDVLGFSCRGWRC